MRRIFTAYGVTKSNAAVDAFEKALKASKVKITKQKLKKHWFILL